MRGEERKHWSEEEEDEREKNERVEEESETEGMMRAEAAPLKRAIAVEVCCWDGKGRDEAVRNTRSAIQLGRTLINIYIIIFCLFRCLSSRFGW